MKAQSLLPIVLLIAHPAAAQAFADLCDRAALSAARDYGVPEQVMLALTRVETGVLRDGQLRPWPWAIHMSGQGYWPETAQAAADLVRRAQAEGTTNVDLGCFQLNLRWHGQAFSSVEDMLDPTRNAAHAARFLVEKHEEKGNWVDAVAAYHSATPDLARRYVERVEEVLLQMAETAPAQDPSPAPLRDNRFPLLQPGLSGSLASLVPQAGAGAPLLVGAP